MVSPPVSADRPCGRSVWSRRFVVAVLTVLVLTGCSDRGATSALPAPDPGPTTSPGYSPELCSAADRFQAAAGALVTLDVEDAGAEGVKEALRDVHEAAEDLAVAARGQFGPQAADLERALASLGDALDGLDGEDGLLPALSAVAAALGAVGKAAKPIVDGVRTGCPVMSSLGPPTS